MKLLSILDRYLVRKFLGVLLFAVVAMVSIFVAVNYVENADRFIDRRVPNEVIVEYYLNFVPHIVTLTLPVDIMLASLFSVGSLARFNELTAIKASGISIYRLILPLLLLAVLVTAGNFWISENVVPSANRRKSELWQTHVERGTTARRISGTDITLYDPSGVKVVIDRFDRRRVVINNISIQHYYGTSLISRVDALEASWDSSRSLWVLKNGAVRTFEGGRERVEPFTRLERDDLFFAPDDILKREQNPDEMDYVELNQFIEKLKRSGSRTERWEVDYHLKFAYPVTCFCMVLFGAPLAAVRKKSGAGVNIFLTLVVCFAYWIAIQVGRYMGYNQTLDPILASWIGNMIFATLSLLIVLRVRS
jgi:lipopolysaccharide export system permease protein